MQPCDIALWVAMVPGQPPATIPVGLLPPTVRLTSAASLSTIKPEIIDLLQSQASPYLLKCSAASGTLGQAAILPDLARHPELLTL